MGQNLLAGTHLARQVAAGAKGDWCSLELLRPELAQDAQLRESFLSDARRAIGLVDTRLVGTRTLVSDEGASGRTTEWVEGQPLSRVLERVGRAHFPLRLQLWMICEVLSALDAAERLSAAADPPGAFVHGALSPDSVLLTYDGQVRLLGVGFAATLKLLEQRLAQLALEPGYVSPERYVGSDPTPNADLYGAGALLWEALTQMDRALASSVVDVSRPRESDETPSTEEICPQAPERLKRICDRALAFNPSERYPNASALRAELAGFLSDTRPAAEPEPDSAALAELLLEHFAAERTTLQSLIELHTSRLASSPAPAAPGPILTRFSGEGAEDGTFTVTSFEEEPRAATAPPEPAPVRLPPPAVPVPEPQALTPRSVQRLDPELLSSARRLASAGEQPPSAARTPRRLSSELGRLSGTALGVAGILALFAFAFYGVPRVREPEPKAPAAPVVRSALLPAPPRNPVSGFEPKNAENGVPSDAGAARQWRPAPIEIAPLVPERDSARAPAAKAAPPSRATAAINEPRWKTQFKKILRSAAPRPVAPAEPLPIDEADPYSR